MEKLLYCQALGKQVSDGEALHCPVCSDDQQKQPMCSTGGNREVLFCPHCDETVEINSNLEGTWCNETLNKPRQPG